MSDPPQNFDFAYDWEDSGNNDYDALVLLKDNGIEDNGGGILIHKYPIKITPKLNSALDYLCYEWDYAYSSEGRD